MNGADKITRGHLQRRAVVYVRQSTVNQLRRNKESTRLQYSLQEQAEALGFRDVEVIDDDLGVSASGTRIRSGFDQLVGSICASEVGAVFCIEDARLARNGREWNHLIELCALTCTLVVDPHGVYDPRIAQDRLMLGLKGSMAEFELSLFRQRSQQATLAKANRGELRTMLPVGLVWTDDGRIELNPDRRIQEALRMVFRKFRELRSTRQVLLWLNDQGLLLPVISRDKREVVWKRGYAIVLRILKNPSYAGAYAWGRRGTRTSIVDGRPVKSAGHSKPMGQWTVLQRDHHPGYISWEEYEENQRILSENAHMYDANTGKKSGRGGRSLLAGLLRCGRCGRRMCVMYKGATNHVPRYACRGASVAEGAARCISFGGLRVDQAIARELLKAVSPVAVDAALAAAQQVALGDLEQRKALELELEEARYAADLAQRQYSMVDPANRLVAGELEARWNRALEKVSSVEEKLKNQSQAVNAEPSSAGRGEFLSLANDLSTAWNSPQVEPRVRQQIAAILIEEVIADVDKESNEIVLVVRWAGGQHSELRVCKGKKGHTGRWTDPDAKRIIRSMAKSWCDRDIALTLNRLRIRTGTGQTWTERRVYALRYNWGLPAFDPNACGEDVVSLQQAASVLDVSTTSIRRLIEKRVLPAVQVAKGAPWQIRREDLEQSEVVKALETAQELKAASRTKKTDSNTPMIPGL